MQQFVKIRRLFLLFFFAILSSLSSLGQKAIFPETKVPNPFNAATVNPAGISDGIIYFSTDQGLSWVNKSAGLPDTTSIGLGGIAVSDDELGLLTKERGVYLYDFRKDLWVQIPAIRKMIDNNPGSLAFYHERIFVATKLGGIFTTADQGKNWINSSSGLGSLSVRKLVHIDDKLFAGTDSGLYSYDEPNNKWALEYGSNTMQVNGLTAFGENIYLATNQGLFTGSKASKDWKQVLANCSLHNISSDDKTIYAMVYNELLSSVDQGKTWQNSQKGLPAELYTFNVVKIGTSVFAGQWDGVYRKNNPDKIWKSYSNGLPARYAITNMKSFRGILVVSGSERKLKQGMTTDK